jgi:hypothetical protein
MVVGNIELVIEILEFHRLFTEIILNWVACSGEELSKYQ